MFSINMRFNLAIHAEGKHLRWATVPRLPVMHCYRPLSTLHRQASGHTAPVVVPFQHCLTMTTEVFLVLTLQGVAGRA